MLKGLNSKVVLITGAAGNIGAAAVRRFAEEGSVVVASDVNTADLDTLAAEVGEMVHPVTADVTTEDGVAACFAAADVLGGVDLVFVNAGVECIAKPVSEFDAADYERVFSVNVKGAFLTSSAAVRSLSASGKPGSILFTASIAGLQGGPMTSVYNSSKHAVVGLAKCLAGEVGGLGIRVNTLCPGAVDSRMMRSLEDTIGAAADVTAADIKAGIEERSALGRYATPEEIAATAAWVLSEEVPYCHGETFTVGGGLMV